MASGEGSFLAQDVEFACEIGPFLIRKDFGQFFLQGCFDLGTHVFGEFVDLVVKELGVFVGRVFQDWEESVLFPIQDDLPSCLFGQRCHLLVEMEFGPLSGKGKPFQTIDYRMAMCMLFSSRFPQTLKPKRQPGLAKVERFCNIFRGLDVSISAQLQIMRSKSSCSKGSYALMTWSLIFWAVHHSSKESLLWYLSKWAFRLSSAMVIMLGDRSDARYFVSFPLRSRAQGRSLPVPQATSRMFDADYRWRMLASEKKKVCGPTSKVLYLELNSFQSYLTYSMVGIFEVLEKGRRVRRRSLAIMMRILQRGDIFVYDIGKRQEDKNCCNDNTVGALHLPNSLAYNSLILSEQSTLFLFFWFSMASSLFPLALPPLGLGLLSSFPGGLFPFLPARSKFSYQSINLYQLYLFLSYISCSRLAMDCFSLPLLGASSMVFFWKMMLWPAWRRELDSLELACELPFEDGPLDDGMQNYNCSCLRLLVYPDVWEYSEAYDLSILTCNYWISFFISRFSLINFQNSSLETSFPFCWVPSFFILAMCCAMSSGLMPCFFRFSRSLRYYTSLLSLSTVSGLWLLNSVGFTFKVMWLARYTNFRVLIVSSMFLPDGERLPKMKVKVFPVRDY